MFVCVLPFAYVCVYQDIMCMHVFTLNPMSSFCISGVIHTDEEFRSALSLVLPDSGYVLCPGIPIDKYEDYIFTLPY